MSRSQVFLPDFGSDIALTLMLKSWELKAFLFLLDFASTCPDPWVIPASKRNRLRLMMRMGRDDEKFQKRLSVFAGDADLIELRQDGSIFVKYLEEISLREDLSWQGAQEDDDEPYPSTGEPVSIGNGQVRGNGSTGNSYRGGVRQPGRRYSENEGSVRKREYRESLRTGGRRRGDGNGADTENLSNSNALAHANVPANVPSFESKCPTLDAKLSPEMSQPGPGQMSHTDRDIVPGFVRDIPRGRGDSSSILEQEDNYVISSSGIDIDGQMSHVPTQNVPMSQSPQMSQSQPGSAIADAGPAVVNSAPRPTPGPHPGTFPAKGLPPPPENPALVPEVTRIRRNDAIRDVMKFTADASSARDLWVKLWNVCDANGQLPVWDEAIRLLAREIKQGKEPVRSKGAWLQDRLRRLLEAEGVFVPTKAELEKESPESVRGQIQASMDAGSQSEADTEGEGPK